MRIDGRADLTPCSLFGSFDRQCRKDLHDFGVGSINPECLDDDLDNRDEYLAAVYRFIHSIKD